MFPIMHGVFHVNINKYTMTISFFYTICFQYIKKEFKFIHFIDRKVSDGKKCTLKDIYIYIYDYIYIYIYILIINKINSDSHHRESGWWANVER